MRTMQRLLGMVLGPCTYRRRWGALAGRRSEAASAWTAAVRWHLRVPALRRGSWRSDECLEKAAEAERTAVRDVSDAGSSLRCRVVELPRG